MACGNCDRSTAQKYLECLCQLSLLKAANPENQFAFHPLIRRLVQEFAADRDLLAIAAARHAHFFINFAKSHQSDRQNNSPLSQELSNLLLAAKWLQQQGKIDSEFISSLKPCLEQSGYWQEAVELMTQFQRLAQQNQDWEAAIKYRIGEAKYLSLQGKVDQAEAILRRVPSLLDEIEAASTRQVWEAKWLNSLSCILRRQGQFEAAIATLQRAADIERHLDNSEGLAMVLNSLGTALRKSGRLEQAEDVLRHSYELHSDSDNQRSAAMVLHSLGNVLREQGKLDEAAKVLQYSRTISQGLSDYLSLAMVLNSLGNLYQEQGCIDEAIAVWQQHLAIYEQLGDRRNFALSLNRLGKVYLQQGHLEEAEKICQKSVAVGKAMANHMHVAMSLNRLGEVYQRQGRLDEAVDTFHSSFHLDKGLNSKKHRQCLAGKLLSLGRDLEQQGRLEEALAVFQRSQELWEALGEKRRLSATLENISQVHQRLNRPHEAAIEKPRSVYLSKHPTLQSGRDRPILAKKPQPS